jgi:hypothetical protein
VYYEGRIERVDDSECCIEKGVEGKCDVNSTPIYCDM